MKRWFSSALVMGAAWCTEVASAQSNFKQWDITHTINMPNLPIAGGNTVRGNFFDHVWAVQPFGGGSSWQAVPPWTTPPIWPSNPQVQPPGFDPYGTDRLWRWTPAYPNSNYGPFTWPYNNCMPGYNVAHPCFNNPWPAPANPVAPGSMIIYEPGTGPGWFTQADLPTAPPTFARSEVEVQPFAVGSGALSARIRSAGEYHSSWGAFIEQTYAFAWTQLSIGRVVKPQLFPPGIPISWALLSSVQVGGSSPVAAWMPANAGYPIQAFYDPITFVVTDAATAATSTGELFELVIEIDQGWSQASNGYLALDTQNGGLRVRMDHPFISPRGTLDLEVAGGQVVTSRATGYFASMALPPVGSSTPFGLSFPSSTFDFVFDATSVFPNDHDVTFYMGGGGCEERRQSIPTGACCDNGVCTSGVTEQNCTLAGGTWQGPGTACPDVPYAVDDARVGFEDIALIGVPSTAGNCDNCGENVPLGFSFDYFGAPHTSVGIASNGYLAFSGPLNVALNQPLPSASGPNGLLAGYWDDLDPLAGGDVHYATLGVAPNRRFIAQWTDVPHKGTNYPLHTFQIVLREGSNEIDYVYLDTPVVGGSISPTLGIENAAGSAGLALDVELLTPKGSRRFIPAPGITCAPPPAVPYCTAGTTTNGCAASMSASGMPSVSQSSGFVVNCNAVEGQKQGILFYGISGTAAQPWGPGSTSFLCVKAPYQRTGATNSGGVVNQCNGALSVDLLAYLASHPTALGMPFVAGQQCWAQGWFRDPPTLKTTSLSNGLAVTFVP